MIPKPESIKPTYQGSEKLKNKTALITGYMTGQVLHPNGGVIVNS